MDDVLLAHAKVNNKKPDTREKLATMPFHFCDCPARMTPHCGFELILVVQDYRCLRRTPDWPRHKRLYLAVQDVIDGQPDDILDMLRIIAVSHIVQAAFCDFGQPESAVQFDS